MRWSSRLAARAVSQERSEGEDGLVEGFSFTANLQCWAGLVPDDGCAMFFPGVSDLNAEDAAPSVDRSVGLQVSLDEGAVLTVGFEELSVGEAPEWALVGRCGW
eukprot:3931829-Rhodomonas_salina.2